MFKIMWIFDTISWEFILKEVEYSLNIRFGDKKLALTQTDDTRVTGETSRFSARFPIIVTNAYTSFQL